jgi:hypothetical protein
MEISNRKILQAQAIPVGKWFYGVSLHKCPIEMFKVFKPTFRIWCFKIEECGRGEMLSIKKGFQKELRFPYAIRIEIWK